MERTQARLSESPGTLCEPQQVTGSSDQKQSRRNALCHLAENKVHSQEVQHLSQQAKPRTGHREAPEMRQNREAGQPEAGRAFCMQAGGGGAAQVLGSVGYVSRRRTRKRNMAAGSRGGTGGGLRSRPALSQTRQGDSKGRQEAGSIFAVGHDAVSGSPAS